MGIFYQLLGTTLLCCSCINLGIISVWPSSTILLFKSENTTLNRQMSEIEISLFGSLPAIGSLIGVPMAGAVLDRLGKKRTTMLTSSVFVIAWTIIAFSNQVEVILTAMFISGLGCAILFEVTLYVSEICQDSIRGCMTSGPMQFYCFGCLVSYYLGGCLSYWHMIYACLGLSMVGVGMIAVLKESPLTCMAAGREEDAAESIAFYRHQKPSSKEVLHELTKLRRIFHRRSEDVQSLGAVEEPLDPELITKKVSCWQFFKNTPATQRQLLVVMVLKLALVLQGVPVIQIYAEPLFAETVPPDVISPNLCSVLMGVVPLVMGSLAAYLSDIVGRRPLIIYSSLATAFCCIVIGTQIQLEWGPYWMLPVFMYLYVAFYTTGAGTVGMVVLAEVFLPEVKSILSLLAVEWAWILNALSLFAFNLLVTSIGVAPNFYFFAFICISTMVFFFFTCLKRKDCLFMPFKSYLKKDLKYKIQFGRRQI